MLPIWKSFVPSVGATPASESSPPGEETGQTKTGGTVTLSSQILQQLTSPRHDNSHDNLSISTAAKTTESTRVRLHEAKSTISEQVSVINSQAVELERLRRLLQDQTHDTADPMELQEVEVEVDHNLLSEIIATQPAPAPSQLQCMDSRSKAPTIFNNTQEQSTASGSDGSLSSSSPNEYQTDARHIPLPDSPTEIVDLQSTSSNGSVDDDGDLHADRNPIDAIFGLPQVEDESAEKIQQVIANLRSKFSAAKFSASTHKKRTAERSPPKKVRFTSPATDDGEDTTSDQESTNVIPPLIGFTVHHPQAEAPAVVDLVDNGSGA